MIRIAYKTIAMKVLNSNNMILVGDTLIKLSHTNDKGKPIFLCKQWKEVYFYRPLSWIRQYIGINLQQCYMVEESDGFKIMLTNSEKNW